MIESFINKYEYYKNVSLKKYNTYKIDVSCDYLVYPKSIHELQELLKYLIEELQQKVRKKYPHFDF